MTNNKHGSVGLGKPGTPTSSVGVEHKEYLEAVDLTSYVGTIPTWLASYFLV